MYMGYGMWWVVHVLWHVLLATIWLCGVSTQMVWATCTSLQHISGAQFYVPDAMLDNFGGAASPSAFSWISPAIGIGCLYEWFWCIFRVYSQLKLVDSIMEHISAPSRNKKCCLEHHFCWTWRGVGNTFNTYTLICSANRNIMVLQVITYMCYASLSQ